MRRTKMTVKLIRGFLGVAALLTLACGNVFAYTLCSAITPSDESYVSLSDYIATGTCQLGDKVFSNFALGITSTGSPSTPITDDIEVTPLTAYLSTPSDYGLEFDFVYGNNTVAPSQTMNIDIQYEVQATLPIVEVYAEAYGGTYTVAGNTGNSVDTAKNLCLGQPFDSLSSDSSTSVCADPGVPLSVTVPTLGTYDDDESNSVSGSPLPATIIGVSDLMQLNGGTGGSGTTADIDGMINDYVENSSVPEPATFLLIGAGLLGVGVLRRKRA
jgi:hypothetical protein